MENLTEHGHQKTKEGFVCEASVHGLDHVIFLASFNIFLSVTASLGNVLILIALHKESSLHPPSKLMFRWLAITDLCVGLICHPVFAAELLSELQNLCSYIIYVGKNREHSLQWSVFVDSNHNKCGQTSRSVAGPAIQTGCNSEACWCNFKLFLACECGHISQRWLVGFYYCFKSDICNNHTVFCLKIFLLLHHHQVQMQDQIHQGQRNGGGIPLNIARYGKTVSAALWVQITLLACYLPQALYCYLLYLFSLLSLIIGSRYSTLLMFLNSSLNPFLYYWKIREVRQAVKDKLKQCCLSN